MCQKLWSEINNTFPFMHEHRPGEDQLYLAVHLKFNLNKKSSHAMVKGKESMSLLWRYSDMHLQVWDQYRLCYRYFTSVKPVIAVAVSSSRPWTPSKLMHWTIAGSIIAVNCQYEHLWSTLALLPSLWDKWLTWVRRLLSSYGTFLVGSKLNYHQLLVNTSQYFHAVSSTP